MDENENFVPTLEVWIARLEMLKQISIEGSSGEQDEEYVDSLINGLYENIESRMKASGMKPGCTFTLTNGENVLEIKFSADIRPIEEKDK